MKEPEPDMLTLNEVAARLRIGRRTLNKYIAAGKLAVVRYSKTLVRMRLQEVERFVRAHVEKQG